MTQPPDRDSRFDPATADRFAEALERIVELADEASVDRRSDARWTFARRVFLTTLLLGGLALTARNYAHLAWFQGDPSTAAVAIIPVIGPISSDTEASANAVGPLIARACRSDAVKALVLRIDSPGGSPTDAERTVASLRACREAVPPKRVIAVIEATGASAGYMVAMAADEVVAARYSLLGSIGAVMRQFDASEAATRWGVRERVYRSGPMKGGLSSLEVEDAQNRAANQDVVTELGNVFVSQVRDSRGERLRATDADLLSGRLWTSNQALALGLVDRLGVLEDVLRDEFPDLDVHHYHAKPQVTRQLGFEERVADALVRAAMSANDAEIH